MSCHCKVIIGTSIGNNASVKVWDVLHSTSLVSHAAIDFQDLFTKSHRLTFKLNHLNYVFINFKNSRLYHIYSIEQHPLYFRIYADTVLNHMTGMGRFGRGSAGTEYNADQGHYPGVPYEMDNFNNCSTCHQCCCISDWTDMTIVSHNCKILETALPWQTYWTCRKQMVVSS